MATTGLAERLIEHLGDDLAIGGGAAPEKFHRDWSGLPGVEPLALVRPRTAGDVSRTLAFCNAHQLPVVPQGGLTGLAGGARPISNAVALSMERMAAIEEIDPAMATMTVQSGVTLQAVQQAADDAGLFFALDLGARGSCTIGGNLSTNAGGNRVIRYGMAREHVLGLEVVLADGTVMSSLNKMLKNNAGYDLKQIFIGSEGTLGVITRAVLRLQPKPRFSSTALCGCGDFDAVLALLKSARANLGPALSAFEVMWPSFYDFMSEGLGLRRALAVRQNVYVLIEATGFDQPGEGDRLETLLGAALEAGIVEDAVIAASQKEVAELWAPRDGVSEFSKMMGPMTSFDVGLPAHRTGESVAAIESGLAARFPGVIALCYGHIGDSNLHIVAHVPSMGDKQPQTEITEQVFAIVREAGGTISAEHGIGLLKKPYLSYSRSPEEIALMRRMKAALDPNGILNPGKVFEA